MKPFAVIFLFVFLMGCAPVPDVPPPAPVAIQQTAVPVPSQTVLPPTSTGTPAVLPSATAEEAMILAYTSEQDGASEIHVIHSDGSHVLPLANGILPKFYPAWSLDGSRLAFSSYDKDTGGLYVMNADGSNPAQLIDVKALDFYNLTAPGRFSMEYTAWSPDGSKIAFSVSHYSGCCRLQRDVYMASADGVLIDNPTGNDFPVWSPDGHKIAFASSSCAGAPGICVVNADGTGLSNLAHEIGYGGSDRDPAWSPDGTKIAFTSGRNGDAEVFVMNADGTQPVNLSRYGLAWDSTPIWSPDGRRIAFSSYRDGDFEIYIMNADGSQPLNLTDSPASDYSPAWSPDGTKLAFVSDRDGNPEIYIVDADGSHLRRLTTNEARDGSPIWLP